MPLDRFFNAIQVWAMQRVKDTDKFLRALEKPIPGSLPDPDQTDRDMDDFTAFAAAVGAPKPDPEPAEA